mmetsp:Transcript_7844/g.17682  ORF Transcript_7844/g.17682 Transcript_7844/m.17682 type:complete len:139 (-) Transcript_7844:332-748(-)
MYNIPAPTDASTTGNPAAPADINSKNDSLAATATIPPCNIVFVENVIPGWNNVDFEYPMVLLIAIPNNMEHGIPDSAMEVDDDIKDAMPKPALAVIAERAIPGMMEGGDEEGVGGVCCLLEVDIDENEDEQMKDELCM